jgi:hypothetical protein
MTKKKIYQAVARTALFHSLIFLFASTLAACSGPADKDATNSELVSENAIDTTRPEKTQPRKHRKRIKHRYVRSLSALDASKFIFNDVKSFNAAAKVYRGDSLPKVTEVPYYVELEGRYFSKLTFTDDFETYVLRVNEGGDCGPFLFLINCRGDSILGEKALAQACSWEMEDHEFTAAFLNDSTFKIVTNARGVAQDSTDYVTGVTHYSIKQEVFVITMSGDIKLITVSDTSWRENKSFR